MFGLVTAPKPKTAPLPLTLRTEHKAQLEEYTRLSEKIGLKDKTPAIGAFQLFMVEHQIPVYNLPHVVRYMDRMARFEAKRHTGWLWKALRKQDWDLMYPYPTFGQQAHPRSNGEKVPASDYFSVHDVPLYDKQIPLDAVRKIALIEEEFKTEKVAFLVSDYAPYLESRPVDPFLLACIPNRSIASRGRFVIAKWDEPGFDFEHIVPITLA